MAMTYDGVYSYKMSVLCWSVCQGHRACFISLLSAPTVTSCPWPSQFPAEKPFLWPVRIWGGRWGVYIGTMEVEEEEGSEEVKDNQLWSMYTVHLPSGTLCSGSVGEQWVLGRGHPPGRWGEVRAHLSREKEASRKEMRAQHTERRLIECGYYNYHHFFHLLVYVLHHFFC